MYIIIIFLRRKNPFPVSVSLNGYNKPLQWIDKISTYAIINESK